MSPEVLQTTPLTASHPDKSHDTALVVRLRSVRLEIVMRVLTNASASSPRCSACSPDSEEFGEPSRAHEPRAVGQAAGQPQSSRELLGGLGQTARCHPEQWSARTSCGIAPLLPARRRLRGGSLPAHRPRAAHQLPALPHRAPPPDPALQLHRTHLRRNPPPGKGDRPAAWRDRLPVPCVGRPGPGLPRLARAHHDPARPALAAGPAPPTPRPTHPDPTTHPRRAKRPQDCRSRRLTCTQQGSRVRQFTPLLGRHLYMSRHTRLVPTLDSSGESKTDCAPPDC